MPPTMLPGCKDRTMRADRGRYWSSCCCSCSMLHTAAAAACRGAMDGVAVLGVRMPLLGMGSGALLLLLPLGSLACRRQGRLSSRPRSRYGVPGGAGGASVAGPPTLGSLASFFASCRKGALMLYAVAISALPLIVYAVSRVVGRCEAAAQEPTLGNWPLVV